MDTLNAVDTSSWIVIPLYNEETVIGEVVKELRAQFKYVVCIDDGSADNSATIAEEAGAIVIKHPINLGQGAALQTGIEYALQNKECEYIVTFDADGQHQLIDAQNMLSLAREKKLGMVFGSRFLDSRTKPGFAKKIILKTAVWVSNLMSPIKLTDAHNGLRVLSRQAAENLDLKQDRMAHASEIVVQLGKTQLPWAEYPVEVLYTEYSKSKGQPIINAVNILVELIVK
ncbi:glycosyltransferase family 2 protein [Aurantimicrobium minutum]|uniref:CoA-transferase family protein n=1 Tax=Aurantimicrobium minutum TaxID=708131 RepID=A0A173LV40_9MICO|nr:glycosyltransferase family 2 protein [Aurantimicrobium minutum]BAU98723.1 CoA-transferase family protein [Aurantimicrobium minutum]